MAGPRQQTSALSRALSARLLGLTALWVGIISLTLGYIAFLGNRVDSGLRLLDQIESLKAQAQSQVLAALARDELSPDNSLSVRVGITADAIGELTLALRASPVPPQERALIAAHMDKARWYWSDLGALLTGFTPARPAQAAEISNRLLLFLTQLDNVHHQVQSYCSNFIWRQGMILLGLIGAALASFFVIRWLLTRWVLRPLRQLGQGISGVTGGNLTTRVDLRAAGREFELIGAGFNDMARRLQDFVVNLEEKVSQKTRDVQERSRNLAHLYELSSFLGRQHSVEELCEGFAARLPLFTEAASCAVMLLDESGQRLELAASGGVPPDLFARWTGRSDALAPLAEIGRAGQIVTVRPDQPDYPLAVLFSEGPAARPMRRVCLFPIRSGVKAVGLFLLYYGDDGPLPEATARLYENFGSHLGVAIENVRLIDRDQQYAVMQERSLLARGLHDSIAQSLSFMNIQVQLLEAGLRNDDRGLVDDTVGQIKAGVQECYEDVRELLLNFRERLHRDSFAASIRRVIDRFESQTKIPVELSILGDPDPRLPENQQLQAVFITQEALANVRKHAQASAARVVIDSRDDFELSVSDNGRGIDPEILAQRRKRHVGLSIMRERADKIGAEVTISDVDPGVFPRGTTVSLRIPRQHWREVH